MSGAGAGAGVPATAKPARKRARVEVHEDDELLRSATTPGALAGTECPPTMEPEDFAGLARLKEVFGSNPHFRLLPMPTAAYGALKIDPPGVASVTEVATNCFSKTFKERYSSNEIEVRDLSATHTAADFPVFYTGPSHAHMLPDGGPRVICHTADASTAATPPAEAEDDEGMGAVLVRGAASGGARLPLMPAHATLYASAGAGAGAGAGASDNDLMNGWRPM
jgi:hypothetical protein